MKRLLITLVVVVLSASLSAQSVPITNADVIRLVMARVSDQTTAAVIREASTTQFDLSAKALGELAAYGVSPQIISVMRQPSAAPPAVTIIGQAPGMATGSGPTLAGASAEASKITHTWELSAGTGPTRTTAAPSPPPVARPHDVGAAVNDEAYWRGRMNDLQAQRADDVKRMIEAERSFDQARGSMSINDLGVLAFGSEVLRRKAEYEKTQSVVADDDHAIDALREEGRRAGALPGWFR